MVEIVKLPILGDQRFWRIYDQFTTHWPEINSFITHEGTELSSMLQEIMEEAALRGKWYEPRPERGWKYPVAMLVLKSTRIAGVIPEESFWVRAGDIVAKDRERSRDIFITHSPEHDVPSGYLIGSAHSALRGIFLPLYTQEEVRRLASPRLTKNLRDAQKLLSRRMTEWGWSRK